jgi:hypothetical protein
MVAKILARDHGAQLAGVTVTYEDAAADGWR